MDKKVAVISALFEKKNKRKPKNSKELQDFIKQQGGEEFLKKVDEYISQAESEQSKQAQKAAHGAKLQYFKKLKNQCADDEEVVYYKRGGSVDCGCQKKEEGGEIKKDKPKTVFNKNKSKIIVKEGKSSKDASGQTHTDKKPLSNPKFKNDYSSKRVKDSNEAAISGYYQKGGKPQPKPQSNNPKQNNNIRREEPFEPNKKPKPSGNTDRNNSGKAKSMFLSKQGSKIIDKFKAKCGTKMKKHQQGGSLNRISFMQAGTPKGGIKRGVNGEYYTMPVPYGASDRTGTNPFMDILNARISNNSNLITGSPDILPGTAGSRTLLSLGKPFKVVNGVNYYKNAAGELRTAQEMAKELVAAKKAKPSWFPRERHTDHYVPKNATGIYNELEKAAYEGEQMMKNPYMDWKDFDEMNSVNYWKHGGLIKK